VFARLNTGIPDTNLVRDIDVYPFSLFIPSLWSSGQGWWLQIQRSGFVSRRYQIFKEVVCLDRGPLGLENTIEELLGRKCSCSGQENRDYSRMDQPR
jgi:hypothetical protein